MASLSVDLATFCNMRIGTEQHSFNYQIEITFFLLLIFQEVKRYELSENMN